MSSEDLKLFEGFVRALHMLHLQSVKGENGHHIWEATFRAFGEALLRVEVRPWRRE